MPKFKIQHITKYSYEVPVRDSASQIMLYPILDGHQELVLHQLSISGSPVIELHTDYYNNQVGTFTHSHPHDELTIDSRLEIITRKKDLPLDQEPAEKQWNEYSSIRYLIPYIDFSRGELFDALPDVKKVMEGIHTPADTPLMCAQKFCAFVFGNFTYKKGITTIDTTLDEIWKLRSGVCQDFAHMLLAMLRLVGIPARYVSGYICPNKNGMRGEGATHAWVEAYIPFYGWVGFDPTNNCIASENHVRLAVGRNFYDCSPVRGTYRGTSNHTLEVAVSVAYEDGKSVGPEKNPEPITSFSKNSYRRHQEQQQQQ